MPQAECDTWVPVYQSPPEAPVKVAILFRRNGASAEFYFDTPYMKRGVALPVDELRDKLKIILPLLTS